MSTMTTRVCGADLAERALDGAERVLDRLHEGAADEVDDGEGAAVVGREDADAAAGRVGIVERAQRARVRLEVGRRTRGASRCGCRR